MIFYFCNAVFTAIELKRDLKSSETFKNILEEVDHLLNLIHSNMQRPHKSLGYIFPSSYLIIRAVFPIYHGLLQEVDNNQVQC